MTADAKSVILKNVKMQLSGLLDANGESILETLKDQHGVNVAINVNMSGKDILKIKTTIAYIKGTKVKMSAEDEIVFGQDDLFLNATERQINGDDADLSIIVSDGTATVSLNGE